MSLSTAPSTPRSMAQTTPRRPRDLSSNPILAGALSNASAAATAAPPASTPRPPSANALRPAVSPAWHRESPTSRQALIRPPPSTGELRVMEESVRTALDLIDTSIRAHADALRQLDARAAAWTRTDKRVSELSAELASKADAVALDRAMHGAAGMLESAREELRADAQSGAARANAALRAEATQLAERLAAAEAEAERLREERARDAAEREALQESVRALERRVRASEAATASLRDELDEVRATKADGSALEATAARVLDEARAHVDAQLQSRADGKADAAELRAALGRVQGVDTRVDALEHALARERGAAAEALSGAEARLAARAAEHGAAIDTAAGAAAAHAERLGVLERRVQEEAERAARGAEEAAAGVRAELRARLDASVAELSRAVQWSDTHARSELDERASSLERQLAACAERSEMERLERAIGAELDAKAGAVETAAALRTKAELDDVREAARAAEAAGAEAGAVRAALDGALGDGSALEQRLRSLEREVALKCSVVRAPRCPARAWAHAPSSPGTVLTAATLRGAHAVPSALLTPRRAPARTRGPPARPHTPAQADAHALVDARPDYNELNAALASVDDAVARAAPASALSDVETELRSLGAAVRAEQAVCRWLWQSGRVLGPEQRVLWDLQPTNRHAGNYEWARGSPEVRVAAGGLYELAFGVFAPDASPAVVRLLVDDAVVAVAGGDPWAAEPTHARPLSSAPATAARRRKKGSASRLGAALAEKGTIDTPPPAARAFAGVPPGFALAAGPAAGVTFACLPPGARVELAVGLGETPHALNGFLQLRKIFVLD